MPELKPSSDVVACFLDYGYFANMADKLSQSFKKTYYYTPCETEFREVGHSVFGDGLDNVERCDNFLDPDVLKTIDLFICPDTGMAPLQKYLKSIGKAVWGSMDASEIEYSRTRFIQLLKRLGLPTVESKPIKGITALAEHLKGVQNKWVKLNKYRANMETWHHIDYAHSQRKLEVLSLAFGGAKELAMFLVQDNIETEIETGYDGWCIDGEFPVRGFCGYENKNQAYLAALTDYKDLPEGVRTVNEALAPILKQYGYRNFWSTEVRIKDGVPYFIDPTARAAGLALEQQQESLTNMADVIWFGANGEMIEPEYSHKFCVEATVHYSGDLDAWKTIKVPQEVRRWFKADHYCVIDDCYQYPISPSDELGVLIGLGDTPEEAIDHLKESYAVLKDEPLSIDMESIVELLDKARNGKADGVKFGDAPVPDAETVVLH